MSLLTKEDRCDGCSAEAKSLVVLRSGGELLLCGHHTDRHREALEAKGGLILDPAAPETTVQIPKADMDRLMTQPSDGVRRIFIPRTVNVYWYEVNPGRYTPGSNRADAEDRFRRTGHSATQESLRSYFPLGHFTEESS